MAGAQDIDLGEAGSSPNAKATVLRQLLAAFSLESTREVLENDEVRACRGVSIITQRSRLTSTR